MQTTFDPRDHYPHFYGNRLVQALAGTPRWSISGQIGDDESGKHKAPLDLQHFLQTGRVRGAWATDARTCVNLDELVKAIPTATNNAFFVKASLDAVMVIDIEKECPPPIAAALLQLPEVEYRETSMSGLGFHLLLPLPAAFFDGPHAAATANALVLREEHGWYEILLEHWVTFTRQPVAGDAAVLHTPPAQNPEFRSAADLLTHLAGLRKTSASAQASSIQVQLAQPEIPGFADVVAQTLLNFQPKKLAVFNDDLSRWEFSTLCLLHSRLSYVLQSATYEYRHDYTDEERAWLLYRAGQQVIPHRDKHDQSRNGRPFILDRAVAAIALSNANAAASSQTPA